jgi:23S rRNA (cytidine1920-2'-O)/16S rRNA (cytidine1409-2'-O)-methyltransferase
VRDAAVHARVVSEISAEMQRLGLSVLGSVESPVRGPAGNREYLLAGRRS